MVNHQSGEPRETLLVIFLSENADQKMRDRFIFTLNKTANRVAFAVLTRIRNFLGNTGTPYLFPLDDTALRE